MKALGDVCRPRSRITEAPRLFQEIHFLHTIATGMGATTFGKQFNSCLLLDLNGKGINQQLMHARVFIQQPCTLKLKMSNKASQQ